MGDERVCFICNMTPEESDGENGPMMSTLGGDACKDCAEQHGYEHPRDMIYLDAETFEAPKTMTKTQAQKKFLSVLKPYWLKRLKGEQKSLDDWLKRSDKTQDNKEFYQNDWGWWNSHVKTVQSGAYGPASPSGDTVLRESLPDSYYTFIDSIAVGLSEEMYEKYDYDNGFDLSNIFDDETHACILDGEPSEDEYSAADKRKINALEKRWDSDKISDDEYYDTWDAITEKYSTQKFHRNEASRVKCRYCGPVIKAMNSVNNWNWEYLDDSDEFWENCKADKIPTRELKSLTNVILGKAKPKAKAKSKPKAKAKAKAKAKTGRKAPTISATRRKIGTRMRGNDGKMWEVKKSGKSQRWMAGAETFGAEEPRVVPRYVYHATPEAYWQQIEKQGSMTPQIGYMTYRAFLPRYKEAHIGQDISPEHYKQWMVKELGGLKIWASDRSKVMVYANQIEPMSYLRDNVILKIDTQGLDFDYYDYEEYFTNKPIPLSAIEVDFTVDGERHYEEYPDYLLPSLDPSMESMLEDEPELLEEYPDLFRDELYDRFVAAAEETQHSETDAYSFAYSQGHTDGYKNKGYKPQLSRGSDEKYFRKILNQRAESYGAEGISKKSGLSWIDTEETDETWDDEMEVIEKHLSSQGYKKIGSSQFFSNRTYAYVLYRFRKYLRDLPDKLKGYSGVVEDREYLNYMSDSQFVFSPWENKAKNKVALVWQFSEDGGFLVSEPYYKYFSLTTPPSWYDRSFELHVGEDYRFDSCPICDYKNPMKSLSDARKLAAHIYSHGPVLDGSPFGDFSIEIKNWWDGETATAYWGNPVGSQTEILESRLPYLYGLDVAEYWSPTKAQQARYTKKEKAIKAGLRAAGLKPKR